MSTKGTSNPLETLCGGSSYNLNTYPTGLMYIETIRMENRRVANATTYGFAGTKVLVNRVDSRNTKQEGNDEK